MARHGLRQYNGGCRCDVCVRANTEAQRKKRQRARERQCGPNLQAVPDPPSPKPATRRSRSTRQPAAGDLRPEQAARTVTSGSTVEAVENRLVELGADPSIVASAVALARVCDTPGAIAQHPAAAGRLIELLLKLSPPKSAGGNLSLARQMAQRSGT